MKSRKPFDAATICQEIKFQTEMLLKKIKALKDKELIRKELEWLRENELTGV